VRVAAGEGRAEKKGLRAISALSDDMNLLIW
jgi:hypothetical protein